MIALSDNAIVWKAQRHKINLPLSFLLTFLEKVVHNFTLSFASLYNKQLSCNFTHAHRLPDEKVRVNLQTGMGKGAGAHNVLHQPDMNLWHPF